MSQSSLLIMARGSRRRMVAGALATTLVTPFPSYAFFQQTKLEGAVGTDLGGVWLSVQNVMPEFRITFPKPAEGPAVPVEVGPLTPDLEPLVGKKAGGVVITNCTNPGFCADNGLLVGDIVISVNSAEVADVAAFQAATATSAQSILLAVRRPALKMSTVRLFKIRYANAKNEGGGESAVQEELDVRLLDVVLPFADSIEKSRKTHELFEPSAAEIKNLGEKWAELLPTQPPWFVKGEHRFVAKATFDESLATDKNLTNAKYAIVMNMSANPLRGGGGGGQLIDVYGIENADAKTMDGTYVTVTIANAPFPINIEFKGRFRMTRIADFSEKDNEFNAKREASKKPPEDLSKIKTLPDVPAPGKPADKTD